MAVLDVGRDGATAYGAGGAGGGPGTGIDGGMGEFMARNPHVIGAQYTFKPVPSFVHD